MKRQRHEKDDELVDRLLRLADEAWEAGRHTLAFRLFHLLATEAGDPTAEHNTGYFYDCGIGVKHDRAKAMYWYRRAFKNGSTSSAINIGIMFQEEGNTGAALRWFRRALDSDDAEAGLNIAKLLIARGKQAEAKQYLAKVVKAYDYVTGAGWQEAKRLLAGMRNK